LERIWIERKCGNNMESNFIDVVWIIYLTKTMIEEW